MTDQPQKRNGLKARVMNWLGLSDEITIKVYHGYGHPEQLTIYGHILRLSPLPRKKYRKSFIRNSLALLRLFFVKPYPNVKLELEWENKKYYSEPDKEGFFRFQWKDEPPLPKGWIEVVVTAFKNQRALAQSKGSVYVPYDTQYGFISDIDDTFLISHSSNLRKRLFVLFTENARSRQPFEGVVKHYQLLALGNTTAEAPNPFFYVSSSEWNLYDYIQEFIRVNKIPQGVFLLNQLKQFRQLLKTGQNHHQTKFTRIARILKTYPNQRFVLLGDSSQQDPYIYESIVQQFPHQIHAVYIRDVFAKNHQKAADVLYKIESNGVPCCFFQHSSDAILHSKKIGLVKELEVSEGEKKEISKEVKNQN